MKQTVLVEPKTPVTHEDALRVVDGWSSIYNNFRLHSGIGYVTPRDKLLGNADTILDLLFHDAYRIHLKGESRRRKKTPSADSQSS